MATLGQGMNHAAINTRDGRAELLALDGVSELAWGRKANAYSEASVTVLARLDRDCWSSLGDIHTWAHSMVIYRDDERVWEGPVTDVSLSSSQVVVSARDVSAWLTRRRIWHKRKSGDTEYGVLSEAGLILTRAFVDDDPNVLPYVVTVPDATEPTTARDVDANSGYYYDDLGGLVGAGLQWTVNGRAIILSTDNVLLGRTAALVPERDTTTELLISESGEDLATRVTAAAEKESGSAVASGLAATGVSPFYGQHDMLTENLDRKHAAGLTKVSQRAIRRRYPVPQVVTFPEGSTLDPSTPIPIAHLVPGMGVPVQSEATPKPVDAVFTLSEVAVKQDSAGEAVTVTLAPVAG